MKRDLNEVLDEIEEFLEGQQDADLREGKFRPNKAMQLLMDLTDSRSAGNEQS